MGRYEWPGEPDPQRKDRARTRAATAPDTPPGAIFARASAKRAQLLAAQTDPADTNVWLPIGPSSTVNGQGGSDPRVAGRVRDVQVHSGGQRAYAATANGGVWYTSDAGTTWNPLGGAGSTPAGEGAASGPSSLVTGTLVVTFGADAAGAQDVVFAGTGELRPSDTGLPGGSAAGIGVIKLTRAVADAIADPSINPWTREGDIMEGSGIYRLARDPAAANANTAEMLAASSIGLFKRNAGGNWSRVTAAPFGFDADDDAMYCTDVVWTRAEGAVPARIWVALVENRVGAATGLYMAEAIDGPYTNVPLPSAVDGGRLGISAHAADQKILYVLGKGPNLWRVDGSTARIVRRVPTKLFGDSDQSFHDLAVQAHPTNASQVIVGGSLVLAEQNAAGRGGDWSASLFRLTISGTAGANNFACNFDPANNDNASSDANTYIGTNVHPDVHVARFANGASDVWVGCDGGLFRSTSNGDNYTFVPLNAGLAVVEPGFVANHPTHDGFVIVGTQDNGRQRRIGNTLWELWDAGDGGGVAFHPSLPNHYLGQFVQGHWDNNTGHWNPPVYRLVPDAATDAEKAAEKTAADTESGLASFYSDLDVIPADANKARVAIGTHRVWVTEDWDPANPAMNWVTLPSNNDPRAFGRQDFSQDSRAGKIVTVQWAGAGANRQDRVVALFQREVVVFNRSGGTWTTTALPIYDEKCGDDIVENSDIDGEMDSLPPLGSWSDLVIQNANAAPNSAFYVATTGHAKFDDNTLVESDNMDTLWWFNGVDEWHATGLRNHADSTPAPAYTVAVDPDNANIVYVGTAVGVWRGTLTLTNGDPSWAWAIFANGLPDAAVHDISFFNNAGVKILRAALQARGVWEVDLSAAPSPRRTYVRAHPFDTRRSLPTLMSDPTRASTTFRSVDSPDIKVRPAPGSPPPPRPSPLVATRNAGGISAHNLWAFQTALRGFDGLTRPLARWTPQLDARIVARRNAASLPTPNLPVIDNDLWDNVMVAGSVWSDPWSGSEPNEADLHELVHHDIVGTAGGDAVAVTGQAHKIEVMVHHRHFESVPAADVRVLLLRRQVTDANDGGPLGITGAFKTAVVQRLTGATTPAVTDWTVVDRRSPASAVSGRMPRAVSFDVDFSAAADAAFTPGSRWLLLAVVSTTSDAVTVAGLPGATVDELVRGSHHVAARLVVIT